MKPWMWLAMIGGTMARDESRWDAARPLVEADSNGGTLREIIPNAPVPNFFLPTPGARPRLDALPQGRCVLVLDGVVLEGRPGWETLMASPAARDASAVAEGWLWLWLGKPFELKGFSDGPNPEPPPTWDQGRVRLVYTDPRGGRREALLTLNGGAEPTVEERPWRPL